jgi:membrane protease YdiL (CAAX protease family)
LIPKAIIKSFSLFILYEFGGVLLAVFIYEFFFRGFIMFNLNSKINYRLGIFLQALLFLIFLWLTKTSLWAALPYLLFAPFAGIIAHKSKSILYSGITQFLIIFLFDANIIRMLR